MEQISELTKLLCSIAVISAVSEAMLSGRRGAELVCRLLSMAGAGSILSICARII